MGNTKTKGLYSLSKEDLLFHDINLTSATNGGTDGQRRHRKYRTDGPNSRRLYVTSDCETAGVRSPLDIREPLIVDVGRDTGLVPPWKTSICLSFSFLFVYTGFEAIQNLQSSLNIEGNVGIVSLAVLYMSVMLGTIFIPMIVKYLGPKVLVLLSFVCHLFYLFSNIYPTMALLVSASFLLGFSISGSAVSEALFSAVASHSYVKSRHLDSGQLHRVLSMFYGVFYCCFKGTHITGNLISSSILSINNYNTTVLEGNVCGAQVCAGATNTTVIESPEPHLVYVLLGVFMCSNVIGTFIAFIGLPSLKVGAEQHGFLKEEVTTVSGCFNSLLSIKFLLLTPMFMSQAMIIMIMYSGYTKAFVTCAIGIEWVGYSMISLGAFSAVSSLLFNSLVGHVGRVAVFSLAFVLDLSTLTVLLLWQPDSHTEKGLMFILPAVAGISEGITQPQTNALIAAIFHENLASRYSAFQACKCLAFSVSLVAAAMFCLYHQLYLALTLYILGIIGYAMTERRERNQYERFG